MDINSLLAVPYIKSQSVLDEYDEYKVGPCCSLNGCPKPLDKMLPRQRQVEGKIRGGNAFAVFFFGAGLPRFCWEFWQKGCTERGFSLVKLWWIAGEGW